MARKNARLGLGILAVVIGMAGLAYASVPLYNLFCRVTGFGGTPQLSGQFPDQIIDRDITINFDADTASNLPWDFDPEQRTITVKIGQKGLMAFHAKNKADKPVAGSAIYNVTPLKVGKYFHKVQCFCFDEQILKPGEAVAMPVMFYIDPKMHEDRNMDDVQTITLSYTFFKSESEELEQALEDFYNQ
ncbi:MAG: cytochrome c oxidase assembly protein [Rhodospirillales bacterium]|nr:cytochrome c oxidase assembly protein [Rhodospirillales bacterium]